MERHDNVASSLSGLQWERMIPALKCLVGLVAAVLLAAPANAAEPVSYYNDVRPVIQRYCSGCHQPASKMSGLVLTEYTGILKGGAKHGSAIAKGAPEASPLVRSVNGSLEPRMPLGGPNLPDEAAALLARWVQEGAEDDTPAEARAPQIPKAPPAYTQPPVITGMAFSPDGNTLAVGGFKEIILHKADGSGIEARLLGRSDKIHSLSFTPDGSLLAAVGGTPARFGEIQVWDIASRKQIRSVTATADTLFAGDVSPDGKRIAFGAADKTVRAVELETGKELFKAGHHEDWVLQTVYGIDGKRIVSVGRDRAARLADAETGAFRENVNLLREKLYAIARHPRRDYILIGGEDRVPYLYTMDRPRALKIADDSTLIRKFEEQEGKIFALAFSPDGSRIAVGGIGPEAPIYDTQSGRRVAACTGHEGGIFTIAFHPGGKQIAAAGFDGVVRLYDAASGKLQKAFIPVPIEEAAREAE